MGNETPASNASQIDSALSPHGPGIEFPRLVSEFKVDGTEYMVCCHGYASAMEHLKDAWMQLEGVCSERFDYFQTYDWCANWVNAYEGVDEHDVMVYALMKGNETLMLWPLMRTFGGFGGVRILELISDPLGQYANILVDPRNCTLELGKRVWADIKADQQADAVHFRYVPANGFLAAVLGREGVSESNEAVSSFLDFGAITSWDEYVATFSKSQRKQRRSRLRKLEAQGDLKFEVLFHGHEKFAETVARAVEMKREWLKDTARHSQSLFDDASIEFLSSLGSQLASNEEGPMVHVLSLDGNPIGIEIGMLRNGHYYAYLGAIDMQWHKFSPGKVQMELSQKWAYDAGVDRYDYLCDPSGYKHSWTNETESMLTRFVPLSVVGEGYCRVWKAHVRPALRNVYHYAPQNVRRSFNRLLALAGRGNEES